MTYANIICLGMNNTVCQYGVWVSVSAEVQSYLLKNLRFIKKLKYFEKMKNSIFGN